MVFIKPHGRLTRQAHIQPLVIFHTLLAVLLNAGCAPSSAPRPTTSDVSYARFLDAGIACDLAGNVYLVGTERFSNEMRILAAHSNNSGAEWNAQIQYLNSNHPGDRGRPLLCVGGPREAYVIWEDLRNRQKELFFNRTLDGGETWFTEDRRLHENSITPSNKGAPAMACDPHGNIAVVWLDDRDGFDAYYCNRSRDRGDTWLPHDVRVTSISLDRKSIPKLITDSRSGLYLTWLEYRSGVPRLFFNYSSDHGESWRVRPGEIKPAGGSRVNYVQPANLAVTPSGLLLATWVEYQNGVADVFVARSLDRGDSWDRPTALRSDQLELFEPSTPQIRCDEFGHIYIAWQALGLDRNGWIILKSSNDGARTWQEVQLERGPIRRLPIRRNDRLETRLFSMEADHSGNVFFSWIDQSLGTPRVAFDRVGAHGQQHLGFSTYLEPAGHFPNTLQAPEMCADELGTVHVLWNDGRSLVAARSPFLGDSGWHFEIF